MEGIETTMDLAGTKEVADILAVTTKRVHQLVGTGTFPTPVAELACGRIWRTQDILDWKDRARPEHDPSSQPDIPPPYPAMRSTDPWDADAIRWVLGFKGAETFRPHELLAYLRDQPSALRRDPDRAEEAHELARQAELTVGRDVGGRTIHLFRSDLGRPTMYPRSAAERRKWLKAHGRQRNHRDAASPPP